MQFFQFERVTKLNFDVRRGIATSIWQKILGTHIKKLISFMPNGVFFPQVSPAQESINAFNYIIKIRVQVQ